MKADPEMCPSRFKPIDDQAQSRHMADHRRNTMIPVVMGGLGRGPRLKDPIAMALHPPQATLETQEKTLTIMMLEDPHIREIPVQILCLGE